MAFEAFDDGRKYEGLVRQLNSIFDEINQAKDRAHIRSAFQHIVEDIFPKIESLSRKYDIKRSELAHNAHIYACCVDEKFYQNYKSQQEQSRKEIHANG